MIQAYLLVHPRDGRTLACDQLWKYSLFFEHHLKLNTSESGDLLL